GVILGMTGQLYPESMRPSFWLVGASLVPGGLAFLGESVLVSKGLLTRVATITIGESLLRTGIWVVLVVAGFGLTTLFLALPVLRVLACIAYYRRQELRPILSIRRSQRDILSDLFRRSPTFLGILMLAAGINRLDFIMLSALGTLADVGQYSAPYKLYETALMVPSMLTLTVFPEFARVAAASQQQFNGLLRQFVRVVVTVGLPVAVVLAFVAGPLMVLLFGSDFASAADVLVILAISPVFIA